ncbi:MAG TPA: hypothetical protein VFS09_11895 [Candidatus Eisenbacteria bacterium]|nr:hypothetical protein [Candidatus Eisenbacteria bacterium]
MTTRPTRTLAISYRIRAILQAALFVASLVSAPLVHEWTCDGACARASLATAASADHASAPPCHAGAGPGSKGHGCNCTDGCCSLWAQFVSPPALERAGAPTRIVSTPVAPAPEPARRAPAARLLPYPTGPPATA